MVEVFAALALRDVAPAFLGQEALLGVLVAAEHARSLLAEDSDLLLLGLEVGLAGAGFQLMADLGPWVLRR